MQMDALSAFNQLQELCVRLYEIAQFGVKTSEYQSNKTQQEKHKYYTCINGELL